jgi:sugar-specific transcriptional regulator TrmB
MDRTLANSLFQLGCNEKHIKFYRANLELGVATLLEITKKARLQRSTAYLIASELVGMGLINEDHKTYKKLFAAAEPDRILQKLEAKYRQIGRNNIALKEVLPELRAVYQTTTIRPRVRTFEGKSGLVAVWNDILAEQQEILLWTNQKTERFVFGENTHDLFIKERLTKGIATRVLAVNNAEGVALRAIDSENMRQTKLLPNDTSFTSETYIYGNKVAILDMNKDIFGIITESEQIASSQRAIFEHAWHVC